MLSAARLEQLLVDVEIPTFDEFLLSNPELRVGLFGPDEPLAALRSAEHVEARAQFVIAWERRRTAIALQQAAGYPAAVRLARATGARPTQLAKISGVTRASLYEWLRGCS
jgi:hypothetical protein